MTYRLSATAFVAAVALYSSAIAQDATPQPAAATAEASRAEPAAASTTLSAAAPAAEQGAAPQLGAPSPGKGQIVFFRSSFQGQLIRCTVREEGALVSGLGNGHYFVRDVEPGLHTFTAATEAKDTLRVEVEAGEVYYNRCSISMGMMVGRPNLSPSDKATFDKASAKLKLQAPPSATDN